MDTTKELIIKQLRDSGCRITKQRQIILDIILEENCTCCKEIYYKASKLDSTIGTATVYRMINTLEVIGAINRKNMYKIICKQDYEKDCEKDCEKASCCKENACTIELEDNTVIELSEQNWNKIIQTGLQKCGYIDKQELKSIKLRSCLSD